MRKRVLILMGSDSDLDVMTAAVKCLRQFDVVCDVKVCSVHRSPDRALELARGAREAGVGVIIAGALAAKSTLPVIGVPIANGALHGVDALYATVQMPPGVPVATVAVNGAQNAALLAVQILATGDEGLADDFAKYKAGLVDQVEAKDRRAQERLADQGLA